jgi:SAM-dependent methyltransferase
VATTLLKDTLLKLGGWKAAIYFGGAADVDRWKWLAAHALNGTIRTFDAGSGLGALSFHAAHVGNEVVAISFVPEDNRKARKRAKILGFEKIEFVDGDLRELDKMAESLGRFDQIFCIEVIEHVIDDAKLIRDLSALLKPGGKLLLSTPYKFHRRIADERISDVEDGGHVRFGYTVQELRNLFEGHGLQIISEDLITGVVCQQIDNVLRAVRSWTTYELGWVVAFPLRVFQILDRPITTLTRWPYLSIAAVAVKR